MAAQTDVDSPPADGGPGDQGVGRDHAAPARGHDDRVLRGQLVAGADGGDAPWRCSPSGLTLTCVGIYGVTSYSVSIRESRRSLDRDTELLSLQSQADLPDQPVIEQSADDRDPVRHAPRRIELRQWVRRIRRPVAPRFRTPRRIRRAA